MDKRFLFRGKSFDDDEWVYGDLLTYRVLPVIFGKDREQHECLATTIGQCTGLTAAKSYRGDGEQERLVFTGDIAQYAKNIYIVRFGPYNVNPENCAPAYVVGYYLQWVSWNFKDRINKIVPLYCIDGMAAAFPAHVADSKEGIENLYLEIIGNMHDHPELLGGEKGATE